MGDELNLIEEALKEDAKLPISFADNVLPIEFQLRSMALKLASKFVGDTCISEGELYQQLKLDGTKMHPVSPDYVLQVALVFERYLWGEWSKGIAENAINSTLTEASDVLEKEFIKRGLAPEAEESK